MEDAVGLKVYEVGLKQGDRLSFEVNMYSIAYSEINALL